MSWRQGFIAVLCVACGGKVVAPSPGTGGSTAMNARMVATGAGGVATAMGGAATAMSAGGIALDAGGKASDAEIMAVASEYCAACPEDGCLAGFEHTVTTVPVACTRALVKFVRCMLVDGCPTRSTEGSKAPPPSFGPCSDEADTFTECLNSHTPTPP